ncbi:MAG: hypothetical protein JJT95_04810 [Pararhodobacter sp.]|nr:hypothetical protein [Pararhodobacter sp.]
MRLALAATLSLFLAGVASAQEPVESEALSAGSIAVTLHLYPFLTAEELHALRQIGSHEEAMRTFLGGTDGFAAIAVSPDEGFFRSGMPVESAVALSQLPDAETARRNAIAACDEAAGNGCVVVLEAAPDS